MSPSPTQASRQRFDEILSDRSRLIAIIHVEDLDDAVPLLDALEEAGIQTIEVTLRSSCAVAVIEAMASRAKGAVIGAGTLTRPEQFAIARDAGARFLVSPAFSSALHAAAEAADLPFLPGVTTPTEVLLAREHGYFEMKCFPADLNGGLRWLFHMAPLFPDVAFCPTGGTSNANVKDILGQPNVFATGGMYMAPRTLIATKDWKAIGALAVEAVQAASA